MPAEEHQDYAILELGSKEELTGFLRKKLTFDFCRSSPLGRRRYVTTSPLNIKPEFKIAGSKPEAPKKISLRLTFRPFSARIPIGKFTSFPNSNVSSEIATLIGRIHLFMGVAKQR
jgi:hypothetical protein